MNDIGRTIKFLRTITGKSQKEVAQRLEITHNYLSIIESGRKEPGLPLLRKIASEFNVPIDFLFLEISKIPESLQSDDKELVLLIKRLLKKILEVESTEKE